MIWHDTYEKESFKRFEQWRTAEVAGQLRLPGVLPDSERWTTDGLVQDCSTDRKIMMDENITWMDTAKDTRGIM